MKKLLLILIFSIIIYPKTFDVIDKKTVLKQFTELQTALRKKDTNVISGYILYPLKDGNTGQVIWKNSNDFKKEFIKPENYFFSHIFELKTDQDAVRIYKIEEMLIESGGEGGDTFMDISGKFVTSKDDEAEFFYGTTNIPKDDDIFVVTVSLYNDMFDGSNYYIFTLNEDKLKLISYLQLP